MNIDPVQNVNPQINFFSFKTRAECINVVAEKVSIIAVAVFSAYTNYKLFIPWFVGGIGLGAYMHFHKEIECKEHVHSTSGCGLGPLERITGLRLPAPLSLAISVRILICEIDHHSKVFVPIVGLVIGAWFGKTALEVGDLLYHKWKVMEKPHAHAGLDHCCQG